MTDVKKGDTQNEHSSQDGSEMGNEQERAPAKNQSKAEVSKRVDYWIRI